MIEEMLTSIPAQEFLKKYPSERWKEVIADVIEISILNLKNSFGTDEFSKGDIKAVLNDLRHYDPRSQDFPTYTRYQNKEYKNQIDKQYYDTNRRVIRKRKDGNPYGAYDPRDEEYDL